MVFQFGSWAYDGMKLDLHFLMNDTSIDWGEYVESSEWDMLSSSAWREERHYGKSKGFNFMNYYFVILNDLWSELLW